MHIIILAHFRQSIVKYVKLLVSEDRKVTALKDLQGHMWRRAYETGKIKGQWVTSERAHVFLTVNLANLAMIIHFMQLPKHPHCP